MSGPVQQSAPAAFNPRLESLRGLAALAVLMTHCMGAFCIAGARSYWDLPFWDQPFVGKICTLIGAAFNPNGAVIFFFVLSGYVLAISPLRIEQLLRPQIFRYVIRRAFRLLPAMWISILAMVVVRWLLPNMVPADMRTTWFNANFSAPVTMGGIFNNLVLIDFPVNPVTWTIYIEIVGSLFVPLLTAVTDNQKPSAGLAVFAILFGLSWLVAGHDDALRYLFCFQIGVFLSCQKRMFPVMSAPGWVFGGGILLFAVQRVIPLNGEAGMFLESAGAAMILIAVLDARSGKTFAWLDVAAFRFLGRISYSFYLVHVIVIYLLAQVFSAAGLAQYALSPFLMIAAAIAVTTPVAWLSYRLIERPSTNYGRSVSDTLYVTSQQIPVL